MGKNKHREKDGQPHVHHKIQLEKSPHNYGTFLKRRLARFLKKPMLALKVVLKAPGVACFALLGILIVSLIGIFVVFGRELPDVRQLSSMDFAETTHIYDRNGQELYGIFEKENRKYVGISDIDPLAVRATVAIEDKNFFKHFGFDPFGIVRAQLKNFKDEGISQGASTITQQLAKNIFLSPERTYERKIKELILSVQIEWYFNKNQILELYLNKIPYGSNAFGIEAAAQTFFGMPAKKLTLAQASVLAALPKAPSYFSPYGPHLKELMGYCKTDNTVTDGDAKTSAPADTAECTSPFDSNYTLGRKDLVLERMEEDRLITREQRLAAWKDGLNMKFIDPRKKIKAPHFVFYVKDLLEQKYGKDFVENGGLQVTTTLDLNLQKLAEDTIDKYTQKNSWYGANNAALVAMDPKNGQILAMVGSRDYWNNNIDGKVNVTISPRQPGSSFKPLVYAAAIQNAGIGSGTFIGDYKTLFNRKEVPSDYDGKYLGKMTVRTALGGSRNIPAIKAYYIAGEEEKLLEFVEKLGVLSLRQFRDSFNKDAAERGWTFFFGWPMAIGSGEVKLLEMVGAYSTFANQGVYNAPYPLLEVRDRDGNILESFKKNGKQAIDPQVAYIINNMLSDISSRPAGSWRWLLTIPGQNVAAKTGTSNKKVRNIDLPNNDLTIGYTPSLAAGVWVGNTDGKNMRSSAYSLYTSDPIYHDFFMEALKGKPREEFPKPEGLKWLGREVYPGWYKPKDYEKMFKRLDAPPPVPLSDFLKKTTQDIKAYESTKNASSTLPGVSP